MTLQQAFGVSLALHLLMALSSQIQLKYSGEPTLTALQVHPPINIRLAGSFAQAGAQRIADPAENIARQQSAAQLPAKISEPHRLDAKGTAPDEPDARRMDSGVSERAFLPELPLPALLFDSTSYLGASEVSRPALLLEEINFDLGFLEGDLPIPGVTPPMIVTLWINENGGVDRVDIVATGYTPEIISLVHGRFVAARFSPAEKNGGVVKSRKKIEAAIFS